MRRLILLIVNSMDATLRFQQALSNHNVEQAGSSSIEIKSLLRPGINWDLVIFESRGAAKNYLEEVMSLTEEYRYPLLVITDEQEVGKLRLSKLVASDFIMSGASVSECKARALRLLDSSEPDDDGETIVVDSMTINLQAYQVTIGGEPLELTYLEYALLAFFAQHPNHTFSRDELLRNVWGFDYYGGSRTVDVHVRRIRSKLGPHLAQHLETIRGVGYLWNVH